ncbi:hypothetical protein Y032_0073g747 [Ancylostoma ceylanicum]|uniref:Uncharacterized protein n=1 Tax=Ancylostoma ceylanicum TaxID=53326 RepID=A0A016TV04_9BILA|nr:hypothetical protein Y032_0073g747 [Ancylostoma ceylanicum]
MTAGGRHMHEVNAETRDERRMIIEGTWQSIGIFYILATTLIASSFWAHLRKYDDELRLAAIYGDVT